MHSQIDKIKKYPIKSDNKRCKICLFQLLLHKQPFHCVKFQFGNLQTNTYLFISPMNYLSNDLLNGYQYQYSCSMNSNKPSCRDPTEVWKSFCQLHERRGSAEHRDRTLQPNPVYQRPPDRRLINDIKKQPEAMNGQIKGKQSNRRLPENHELHHCLAQLLKL